jgi:hypothetical protein
LATGKNGNPLAVGKPFINNFLPNGGDMLRLNMAVPATDRDDPAFSSLGLIQAAVLGLTDPQYASNAELEFIPNMDGFPNGRRLEDDVTRIELQAVSGVALAAIGLWYDDYDPETGNPVTQDLLDVLTYSTGVEENDKPFQSKFPYVAAPFAGDGPCSGAVVETMDNLSIGAGPLLPEAQVMEARVGNYPNPFLATTTIQMELSQAAEVRIEVINLSGQMVQQWSDQFDEGVSSREWNASNYPSGIYYVRVLNEQGEILQLHKLIKAQ